jgi:hypothetical protein
VAFAKINRNMTDTMHSPPADLQEGSVLTRPRFSKALARAGKTAKEEQRKKRQELLDHHKRKSLLGLINNASMLRRSRMLRVLGLQVLAAFVLLQIGFVCILISPWRKNWVYAVYAVLAFLKVSLTVVSMLDVLFNAIEDKPNALRVVRMMRAVLGIHTDAEKLPAWIERYVRGRGAFIPMPPEQLLSEVRGGGTKLTEDLTSALPAELASARPDSERGAPPAIAHGSSFSGFLPGASW